MTALLALVLLAPAPLVQAPVVHFSPRGGCTAEVVLRLDAAAREVRVLAYSFTSRPIAAALARAKKRGVDVQVIVDKSQPGNPSNRIGTLTAAGIPVRVDHAHAIAHNKVVVIDRTIVLTGSFNFSAAAESSNAENLLTLTNPDLATRYLENWADHAGHSTQFPGRLPGH